MAGKKKNGSPKANGKGKHPNSLKNLKPIKPGEVRNPTGRPKNQPLIAPMIRRILTESRTIEIKNGKPGRNKKVTATNLEHLIRRLVTSAIDDGDDYAASMVFDRIEGRAIQSLRIGAEDPLLDIMSRAAAVRARKAAEADKGNGDD